MAYDPPLRHGGLTARGWEPVPWNGGDVARALLVALGVALSTLLLASGIREALDLSTAGVALVATGALDLALLVIVWHFTVHKYGCGWSALGLRPMGVGHLRRTIPRALLVSLLLALLYGAALQGLGLNDDMRSPSFLDEPGVALRVGAVLAAVLMAPLVEELFFRGFMLQGLRRRLTLRWAAVTTSLIWALVHIDPLSYVPIFAVGLVLVWVLRDTRSLAATMLVHAAYNGVILAIVFSS